MEIAKNEKLRYKKRGRSLFKIKMQNNKNYLISMIIYFFLIESRKNFNDNRKPKICFKYSANETSRISMHHLPVHNPNLPNPICVKRY